MQMMAIEMQETGGPEVLRLVSKNVPNPGPGEVLIRVEAAGVNFGEALQRAGVYPVSAALPLVPGSEVAGVVVAVGAGVSALPEGSRVLALLMNTAGAWGSGGYAEYALARAEWVIPLPASVGSAEATALAAQGLTAHFLLQSAGSSLDTVLVHAAAGGVGSLAVQLARLYGSSVVLGTAGSEAKRSLVERLGAIPIDYSVDTWPDAVRRATEERGVGLILDSMGGEQTRRGLGCLAPFGRIVLYGALSGRMPMLDDSDWARLVFANQSLAGMANMGYVSDARQTLGVVATLLGHAASGRLVLTTTQFSLGQVAEAHRALQERRTMGKVVLTI